MNVSTMILIGVGGAAVYYLVKHSSATVTVNPTTAASTGATYIPPGYVPTEYGWPSPAAPGAGTWGLIPKQGTSGAQDFKDIASGVGSLAQGFSSIWSTVENG